jgi:preprotein translocase subunit SecG
MELLMGIISVLLLVLFIIAAALLILLVLVQNEEGESLGGIFAGGSGSAFGSRSGNVLTRTTSILGAVFLVLSFALALVNRTPGGTGVEAAGQQASTGTENAAWWLEDNVSQTDAGDIEALEEVESAEWNVSQTDAGDTEALEEVESAEWTEEEVPQTDSEPSLDTE